jgi:uncharacterized membrane protein YoaK (UPF0700 family)
MPGESRRNWIIRTVMRAGRPRSSRQIWTVTLALVAVAAAAAIGFPSTRPELLAGIFALGCAGWMVSESSARSRREREALAQTLKEAKDVIDNL